ncbi:aldo/keto reductase [Arthrobacter sp. VKM Ac-2550]|uniref:aldo/keto reductase n=1 Tax=Crystallibacter permensis TaxID=1938888 RepID=UPI0022271AA8|nr:aldo/keto reductase [Arthrobacter sp. VKM Ac-2550]MCW2131565.1 putative oxidoreductase [Arthrobacter sp. VKM Ac-2550]
MSLTTAEATGLRVAPLVLGTNVFGWTADEAQSHQILDAFTAAGGNFIDTADSYSFWVEGNTGGESETIIGTWLAKRTVREEVLIASKVSYHPELFGLAPATIRQGIDGTLRRLGLEYVDVYYAHFDDPETPLEQTIATFSELVDEGKIRAIGVSNYSAERLTEWMEITKSGGYHIPVALEPQYNLMERGIEERLLPLAREHRLEVFPYYSLAHGFLTGKYRPGVSVDSARADDATRYLDGRGKRVLEALGAIAADRRLPYAPIALAWLRSQPGITAPIASGRTVEQLEPLLETIDLVLNDDELSLLTAASQNLGMES